MRPSIPLHCSWAAATRSELARAARIGESAGYSEINLNVGCPSDRVKNGSFGACLMLKPALVAECVSRMRDAVRVPVTVKCRIGIDDRDDYEFFSQFVDVVVAAGVDALIVHARAAILGGLSTAGVSRPGLSPKENREIPPLKYDYVHRLKSERPSLPPGHQRRLRRVGSGASAARCRPRRRDVGACRLP